MGEQMIKKILKYSGVVFWVGSLLTGCVSVNSKESIPQYIVSQKSHFQLPKTKKVTPNIPQIENINTIAIIEMSNAIKDSNISLKLHTILVKYFLKTNRFKVLERKRIDKIFQELELGITGIVDETKASKIGKILGADAILTGEIRWTQDGGDYTEENGKTIKIGSHPVYEAHLRLISVETSSILWTDKVVFNNEVKPESVNTNLNQLLLKPKTVKLKTALLTSYYDNVRGVGPKKYVYSHDERPILILSLDNAQYVNISYTCFKKNYSKPKMGSKIISFDKDNYGGVFKLPSGDTFESIAKLENIRKFSGQGIFIVQIKAEENLLHEIHYVINGVKK